MATPAQPVQPSYEFGEFPLHITASAAGGYEVDPEEVQIADECAINPAFPAERLEIMQARAASYGYVLVVEEPAPESPTPGRG